MTPLEHELTGLDREIKKLAERRLYEPLNEKERVTVDRTLGVLRGKRDRIHFQMWAQQCGVTA